MQRISLLLLCSFILTGCCLSGVNCDGDVFGKDPDSYSPYQKCLNEASNKYTKFTKHCENAEDPSCPNPAKRIYDLEVKDCKTKYTKEGCLKSAKEKFDSCKTRLKDDVKKECESHYKKAENHCLTLPAEGVANNFSPYDNILHSYVHKYFENIQAGEFRAYYVSNPPQDDPYLCQTHCEKDDPFCETITVDSNLVSKVFEVKKLLNSKRTSIPKSEMMEIFEQKNDACGRGDITIQGNKLVNIGSHDCTAKYKVAGETFSIYFPKVFESLLFTDNGITVIIDPKVTPLVITHSRGNSILNGPLTYISINKMSVISRIGNLCINTSSL